MHRAQAVHHREAQTAAVHDRLRPRAGGRAQLPQAGDSSQRARLRPAADRAHLLQRAAAARVPLAGQAARQTYEGHLILKGIRNALNTT